MNGRIVSSNGYIKLLIPTHPNADSKGYVYEHRAVAERKIGRPLNNGEIIHHLDGNRQNNLPENLEVIPSRPRHAFLHRKRTDLRMPGEENPSVQCKCGCGQEFTKFDVTGRPREYVTGHNTEAHERPLCKCGCGQRTIYINRPYIPYHWTKKLNNQIIPCQCGCGQMLKLYDAHGRERKFISGHNRKKS